MPIDDNIEFDVVLNQQMQNLRAGEPNEIKQWINNHGKQRGAKYVLIGKSGKIVNVEDYMSGD